MPGRGDAPGDRGRNEPARTAEVIDADGWMHSGDQAIMDADGYVQITGRIKDMVIRGGENIYPREIEDELPMTVTGKIRKDELRRQAIEYLRQ